MSSSLREAIAAELDQFDTGDIKISRVVAPPPRDAIRTDSGVFQFEAAVLSADIRQYSGITNALGRRVAINMLRSFFSGVVRICVGNGGSVADFNGDGMIVVFTGERRVDAAARAAGQCRWFINALLQPRFADAFTGQQLVPKGEEVVGIDAGFAIDEGMILACRIGVEDHHDAVWVGDCVNTSAKLCKLATSILITRDAFDRLSLDPGEPFHSAWRVAENTKVGGVSQSVLLTEELWPLD